MFPTPRINEIVSLIAAEVKTRLGPSARVIWFGSWVTGSARQTSDIDLAVEMMGGVPTQEYARLLDWIEEELPTLHRVDLINLDDVGEPLRREIKREGVAV